MKIVKIKLDGCKISEGYCISRESVDLLHQCGSKWWGFAETLVSEVYGLPLAKNNTEGHDIALQYARKEIRILTRHGE